MHQGNAIITMILLLGIVSGVFFWLIGATRQYVPETFTPGSFIEISRGSSVTRIAEKLEQDGIISSAFVFVWMARFKKVDDQIKSGVYYFDEPTTIFQLLNRFATGDYDLPMNKFIIYEGEAVYEFAPRIEKKLPHITEAEIRKLVAEQDLEGYLYPDTYSIPITATAQELIDELRENFDRRTSELGDPISYKKYTEDQIITMASIIEKEAGAGTFEEKQKVAGVLWKRLEIGMPLQVDAVFSFIYKEHLPRVLFSHLKVESKYNTYKYKGLTPGPIGNPSIEAIKATINPIIGKDLYYLTGTDGVFYFATTLAAHEKNRRLYIK